MRVVECQAVGPLDGLVVVERDDPIPGPGMVVIDVDAAGVNFVDALFVQGGYQIKPPVPFVPGSEIAGTISAVGSGIDATLVGQRVVAMCGLGGFASKVAVPVASAVPIPDNLDSHRGAAFIQSYCTARFALDQRANLQEGETVLVFGAGGGVGQAAIAVAVAAGARVAAVASTRQKRDAAMAAGAEVAYDSALDATELVHGVRAWSQGGVAVAVDPVGGDGTITALRSLGLLGRLLVIGFPAGIPNLPANQILLRNRSVLGVDWGAWSMNDATGQRVLLEGLLVDVGAGRIVPTAPERRPLDGVVGALKDLVERRVTGKIVLIPHSEI